MRLSSIVLIGALTAATTAALGDDQCPVRYTYCEVWGGDCASGTTQSPIANNASGRTADPSLSNVTFTYPLTKLSAINNGATIKVKAHKTMVLHYGGVDYTLDEFHFHTPAEHRLDVWMVPPRPALAELHLVHKSAAGAVVIAVPIRLGDPNPVLDALIGLGPLGCTPKATGHEVDLTKLLPAIRGRYITYVGSLTTPNCAPNIRFVMMNDGITASQPELDKIKVICNARPVQYNTNRVTFRVATPHD